MKDIMEPNMDIVIINTKFKPNYMVLPVKKLICDLSDHKFSEIPCWSINQPSFSVKVNELSVFFIIFYLFTGVYHCAVM